MAVTRAGAGRCGCRSAYMHRRLVPGPAQEVWLARQQLRALDIVPWPQPQHLVSCQHLLHNLLHSLQNMQHDAPQCVSAWLMHVAWMPHR